MYNRCVAGRAALCIVGRQFGQKLWENTRNTAEKFCTLNTSSHGTTSNFVSQRRNYCDKSSEKTDEDGAFKPDGLRPLPPSEEGAIKLKEYLATPENERMYKIIELEVEVLRQNSEKVPNILGPHHWYELVQLPTRSKRKRYLDFLWSLERKKENKQVSKEEKRQLLEESTPVETPYKLGKNSLFLRIYEATMNQMWNSRLINRILFGQKIVMDCSYESYMTRVEMKYCARQLKLSFAANRMHDDPFDMYLCNANPEGEVMQVLHRHIPPLYDNDFPLNIRTESYLDIFDKKSLVYLTPHCNEEMREFDHNAVYIIGAFIDKSSHEPVSLAKAKKEGLKMMKLPLDRYLQWGSSSGKNLTINAVLNILLDVRLDGRWDKALKHVPRRKLFEYQEAAFQRKQQKLFESSGEQANPVIPLQVPGPKIGQRYNSDRELRPNIRSAYRSSYGRDSRPYNDRDSRPYNDRNSGPKRDQDLSNTTLDFSMEGRAKFNKYGKT